MLGLVQAQFGQYSPELIELCTVPNHNNSEHQVSLMIFIKTFVVVLVQHKSLLRIHT